ncbi:MAG: ABC transporter permease [Acidimicrobiales bacterium]
MTDTLDHSDTGQEIGGAGFSLNSGMSRFFGSWRTAGILIPFLVLFVVLSIASSPFLHTTNLINILDQQAAVLCIAAAGTLVLVAGGIDLSVGSTYALAGVTAGQVGQHHSVVWAILAGFVVGIVVGLINGVIVTVFRISPLITTLAMSYIIYGLALKVTNGNLVLTGSIPGFQTFTNSTFLTVPSAVWMALAVVVVLAVVLSRTTFGRYVVASGGNAEAARLAGVRVNAIKVITFVISGGAAALGGIIDAGRLGSILSTSGGPSLSFLVLAGIVVGGTSIAGGEGSGWRTALGVLFIALIGNGFNLLGVDPNWQQIVLGLILLIAVGLDMWARRARA